MNGVIRHHRVFAICGLFGLFSLVYLCLELRVPCP